MAVPSKRRLGNPRHVDDSEYAFLLSLIQSRALTANEETCSVLYVTAKHLQGLYGFLFRTAKHASELLDVFAGKPGV